MSGYARTGSRPTSENIRRDGKCAEDALGHLGTGPRDQHVLPNAPAAPPQSPPRVRCRFALAEHYFRHAMPQRAMVIDLGEAQVFERHVLHAGSAVVDIRRAAADVFQKRAEPVFGHRC
jgi:hypothetical protein